MHRIGRTGRRDKKGTAYTFFTQNNAKQANELIGVLKEANQEVSSPLFELASQSYRYGKNVRKRYGGYGGGSFGGNRFGGGGGFGGNRRPFNSGGGGGYNSNGSGMGMKRKWDNDSSSDTKRFRPSFNGSSSSKPSNGSSDRYNNFG